MRFITAIVFALPLWLFVAAPQAEARDAEAIIAEVGLADVICGLSHGQVETSRGAMAAEGASASPASHKHGGKCHGAPLVVAAVDECCHSMCGPGDAIASYDPGKIFHMITYQAAKPLPLYEGAQPVTGRIVPHFRTDEPNPRPPTA
ncbi:MAG: hypothetical protein HY751_14010 [Nitrospinae bacterium]|nr:hypothetical protein [Nitrospinota bacterium]